MSAAFDPLHKWLGIPPAQQPPNVYQLLGIQPFENDLDVISNAADQRMSHLRSFAQGPNAASAENLLNQIASARLCLLDPGKKKAYDDSLRARTARPSSGKETPKLDATIDYHDQGALFGAYVVLERIGGGRSGPIFRAKERKTNREVSLKILPSPAAENPQLLKRFEREAKLTSSLQHPNLVGAFGSGQQDGIHFLVLEHLDGLDLATLVQRQGPLPPAKATDFVIQAAKGLAYLHANGVVHRNVKPHNLLVDRTGVVKIANLTVAHLAETADQADDGEEALTKQGDMLGSVDYLAPEQASDASSVDGRADIYSLGCTLHYLLTGRPPYTGKSMMDKLVSHRAKPIPSLVGQVADMPPKLDQVMAKMLGKTPEDRYASMDEVVADLEGKESGGGGFKINQDWLLISAGVGVGVLIASLLFWMMR